LLTPGHSLELGIYRLAERSVFSDGFDASTCRTIQQGSPTRQVGDRLTWLAFIAEPTVQNALAFDAAFGFFFDIFFAAKLPLAKRLLVNVAEKKMRAREWRILNQPPWVLGGQVPGLNSRS